MDIIFQKEISYMNPIGPYRKRITDRLTNKLANTSDFSKKIASNIQNIAI